MPEPDHPDRHPSRALGGRRSLAALLVPDSVTIETGQGFDELQPAPELVSVIVPSYAHEEFIEEALRSIVQQSYQKLEIVLIDDHSPDRTFERALSCLRSSSVPYCAIRRQHAGMESNLNAGILLAHGGWIAMLGSDDAYPERSMENLITAALAADTDVAVGPVDAINREGEFKSTRAEIIKRYVGMSGEVLRKSLLEEHGSMMIQGMLISREVFAKVGLFDPELFASDFDFLLRMASRGVRFTPVPMATALHRHTRTQLSRDHLRAGLRSHLAIARRHARSLTEYRRAAARFIVETAFNSWHYGHRLDAIACLARVLFIAPWVAAGIVLERLTGRLRNRQA